jgi:predicted dehydrogenase
MAQHGMSQRTRVIIIGAGSIGERHLRCFQATGRADVALCEISDVVREEIALKYNVAHSYADLETALADSYDAAVVATPAHLHIPMAQKLCDADTRMLIEKPLSTSLNGINSLAQSLSGRNLAAGVAYVLRHHPALQAMKDAIADGRFGRPVQLTAVCGQHFPTFRPAYREIYYADHASGGGAIQDSLTHVVNAGQWLVGPIDRLVADAAHQVLDGVDVEDTVHVMARHGDVLASYSLNQYQAPNEFTITVVCEQGTCRLELHRDRWAWMTQPNSHWETENSEARGRDDDFVAQANAFLDVVEGRAVPFCTLQEAIHSLNTNLAILASVEDSSWKKPR